MTNEEKLIIQIKKNLFELSTIKEEDLAGQIDKFKRKENPDFKGAFHEKKKRFDTPKAGKNQRQGKSKPKNQRGRRR